MMSGNENLKPTSTAAHGLLLKNWKDYHKPANAHMLLNKFSLDDLLRVAKVDEELNRLLTIIGFSFKN